MPIDPYAALNAMLRAEAARFSPPAPVRQSAESATAAAVAVESEGEPQQTSPAADPAA
ncbi:hypothetical protein ACFWBF_27285 [Streptomyces sp. NPDC060028]|uniref:hypothetical protein n=1 Tax=Streptomyces sp. NPDC060028 TaxID=3347041 RepID=UPI00367F316F